MLSEAFLQRLDALQLAMRAPARGGAGGLRRSPRTGQLGGVFGFPRVRARATICAGWIGTPTRALTACF